MSVSLLPNKCFDRIRRRVAYPDKDVRWQHAVHQVIHGARVAQHVHVKPRQHHLTSHQWEEVIQQLVLFTR